MVLTGVVDGDVNENSGCFTVGVSITVCNQKKTPLYWFKTDRVVEMIQEFTHENKPDFSGGLSVVFCV